MTRVLKIQPFIIPSKPPTRRASKVFPQLLLKGLWFKNAGFNPDDEVTVLVQDGRLIIEHSGSATNSIF